MRKNQWMLAALLSLLIAGGLFAWWTVVRVDRELREDLLQQARLVAQSVDIERVNALTGTPADLDSTEYRRLKEQLSAMRASLPPGRSLYLMGRRADGSVLSLIDSEAPGSRGNFPPGQIIAKPSDALLQVFADKTEALDGPLGDSADAQGATQKLTRLSALLPVRDTATALSGLVTPDDAQAMVRKAVDFYRRHGRERFIKECNDPRGEFRKGSLYAFAYDHDMTMRAHPVLPELVGQNLLDRKDWSGGKYFRKEIQDMAMSMGRGWVDYQYENPANKRIQPKSTYFERVDDLIISAGAYKGSGELLAVLGMGVDAGDWQWEKAARSALPLGMMLVLVIGALSVVAINRRVDASPKPLLRRLLLPLMAMVLLMMLGAGALLWQQQRQRLASEIAAQTAMVRRELRVDLDNQAAGLSMALQPIAADATVQAALRDGDAERLLAVWGPVFKTLNRQYKLTHAYFLDQNRIALLRLHKPERRGDLIGRFTALEAERTGKTASGIELGPLGTFTLRVVQPVFKDGKLVGYVEFGKEIEDIIQARLDSGLDLAVTIRKEFLDRPTWEEGMRFLGREAAQHTALQNTLQFQKDLLNAVPSPIFHKDAQGVYIGSNKAFDGYLGLPSEAIIGKTVFDLSPPDLAEQYDQADRALLNNPGTQTYEASVVHANGKRHDVIFNKATFTDSEGKVAGLIGVILDISERKQAEEKLHLAASVFTHAREGILITSADGTIIDVNEAFTRITGYSRDEVLGRNPRLLSSGHHDREFYATMWRSLIENGHWYGEVWNRRKSGEVFAEMQTISTVRDDLGNTREYVALFSDITALKEHEKQLEHIAHFDILTSLPNRVLLADRLRQAMAQTPRRGLRLAVAFLDLDGFKSINDNDGHEAGDNLLMTVAARMQQTMREGDTLARIGGDEFVAVLIDLADPSASEPLLTRLLDAAAQPVLAGAAVLQVSASLGVTFYPQANDVDADQLLHQADEAMYQAKLAGKNRYHVFDAG
ncbi:diguanylate cyclase domain-containing protein [Propionivibrio sp.]|uniref:diguanylate cyclase domain-containing protein n=1 Tax=Propionivibrio sp. TaxID=2212460 RepID=UPI003BF121CC